MSVLAKSYSYNVALTGWPAAIVLLLVSAVSIVAMWKIFTKAGRAGWKCLIPIYNGWCMFDIVFGKGWMFFLMLIPLVNFVIMILYLYKLAQVFGKGIGFAVGLFFLSPIFMLILAFGDAEYVGA